MNTYIIASGLFFLVWGLGWDRSDRPNALLKFFLLALAVVSAYSLYTGQYAAVMVSISTLVTSAMALIWKARSLPNLLIKLMWIGFVVWGLVQVFQNLLG